MSVDYTKNAGILKALADPKRLMIVDMLSCGELCACKILEQFKITQPTLSHHMKILQDCGLVRGRKEGKWIHYSLNEEVVRGLQGFLEQVTTPHDDCICHESSLSGEEDCCK